MNKEFSQIFILGFIALVVVLAGGFYLKSQGLIHNPFKAPVINSVDTKSQSVSPTPDETANWKTYTDSQYGFDIKYPGDFTIGNPSLEEKTSSDSFLVWVSNQNTTKAKYSTVYSQKEAQIAGYQAIVQETTSFPIGKIMKVYLLKDGTHILFFEGGPVGTNDPSKPFSEKDLSIFNKILSTFKFTK